MSRLMIAVYITKTNAKLWAKFVTLKIPLGKVKANFRMRLNENLNSNLFSNKTSCNANLIAEYEQEILFTLLDGPHCSK